MAGEYLRYRQGHRGGRGPSIGHTLSSPNPSGLCHCGCGEETQRARDTVPRLGWVAGEHVMYVRGHQNRGRVLPKGKHHANWRGGRTKNSDGYVVLTLDRDDPLIGMAYEDRGRHVVLEHRAVMARSLGRLLTRREQVHHINGQRDDNRAENLELRRKAHGPGQAMRCRACGSHDVEHVPLAA